MEVGFCADYLFETIQIIFFLLSKERFSTLKHHTQPNIACIAPFQHSIKFSLFSISFNFILYVFLVNASRLKNFQPNDHLDQIWE